MLSGLFEVVDTDVIAYFFHVSGCKIAVYLATGTAIVLEPDKGSSATAKDILQTIVESEELALPPYAAEVFSIWMASSFLGITSVAYLKLSSLEINELGLVCYCQV